MTPEQQTIRTLSDRLVEAQSPIRILDAIKWDNEIKQIFFKNKAEKLPQVNVDYYIKNPLNFEPQQKRDEFNQIIRDTKNQLGQYSMISQLIENRCLDYIKAIDMLSVRGTTKFVELSKELYGSPDDAFYLGGPRLSDLGSLLGQVLKCASLDVQNGHDKKIYNAQQALELLQPRLNNYFNGEEQVNVMLSDQIIADAAAGSDTIKLNQEVNFSERDLKYLEVHEGWVHLGTTLNGRRQPYCTFLAKGSPASTVTQEGLAVITEVFTFSSYPERLLRLCNRIRAIDMANEGANFIDVYRFFLGQNYEENHAYAASVRTFRGSTPNLGPFTKDLSYTKGFVLIYNHIRLTVQKELTNTIPFLFSGKILVEEVKYLSEISKQGLIHPPTYLPPQFKDLAALSSWMSLSLYLNKFDLKALESQYAF